jgi:hypothetical protein
MPEKWVTNLVEDVIGGSPLQVGKKYMHPEHGLIIVTDGQYWGTHGLSNFWYWNEIDPETGRHVKGHHGYGGNWPEVMVE